MPPVRVILQGPQRFGPTVGATIASLGGDGPVAAVTAGWREREGETAELDDLLEGRERNLHLFERWLDIAGHDPEFATAEHERRRRVEETQTAYAIRLEHAIAAVESLRRRPGDAEVTAAALARAIATVRAIDAEHLEQNRRIDDEFYERWRPHERPQIARHRDAVADTMRSSVAVAIAGGHVGDLLACLHLFNVAGLLGDRPVVAWSAGAMAVSEIVVLFHDHAAHGPGHPEVYRQGLGLARGIVPLPHAARRLRLDDRPRMALLAQRLAPRRAVVLPDGARLDLGDGSSLPDDAEVVTPDGDVTVAA